MVSSAKRHKCDECGKLFARPNHLAAHLRVHSGEKPFQCSECGTCFTSRQILNGHQRIHNDAVYYPCDLCGKGFKRKQGLVLHQRTHSGEKPYKCEKCGKSFTQKAYLEKHKQTHSGEKPYECKECGKGYSRKDLLQAHQFAHTGDSGGKPFPCEVCNKRFALKGVLREHLRIHAGEKPYRCEHCGKRFRQSGPMRIHQRIHAGEKPFQCMTCGARFSQNAALQVHQRTHTGERPFGCDVCDKRFPRKHHLVAHQRAHTGVKPYECELCGKRFSLKISLEEHQRIHSGKSREKPFQCDVCPKRFARKVQVRIHQRVHAGEKPYQCEHCGKRFSHKGYLREHGRTHQGEKPYQCEQCGAGFARQSYLTLHRLTHSKAHKCAVCGKAFARQLLLREHMLHHTDPDQFKCGNCGRRFEVKATLRQHEVSCRNYFKCDVTGCEFDTEKYVEIEDHRVKVHGQERRLKCPICNDLFSSHVVLKRHERRVHHGDYDHACDMCGVVCYTSSRLETHKKNCKGIEAAFTGRIRQVAEKHRIEEDYELTPEVVGQGLSSVLKAKSLQPADGGKEFAVKKIVVKRDTPEDTRKATCLALTEATIAKARCGHKNTAGVEKVYYQDGVVYTVAKLVRPGNLLNAVTALHQQGKTFEERHVASVMNDILRGLRHFHGQGLLHRDMKTDNVLLGADGVCMIVDFGQSATDGPHRGTGGVGTERYRPPEAWGDEKQTTAIDVYPLGLIAAECLVMQDAPDTSESYDVVPARGVVAWVRDMLGTQKRLPPSKHFADFVEKCLQEDAAARPTVAALLEHPFVKLAERSSLRELIADII